MDRIDLQSIATSLRAAVDTGDLGAIVNGVAVLEGFAAQQPLVTVFRYSDERVAFNIKYQGTTVCLRLNMAEIHVMIRQLREHQASYDKDGETIAWWEWGSGDCDEDPPILLYRDDWLFIELPHDVGVKFLSELEIIRDVGLPNWKDADQENRFNLRFAFASKN